ncbi:MAG TPA: putative zinc-binding protein [Anaerolineae bacterium]|nr:putative zinc-binding protein [Anaerolineae bacterium]
MVDLPQKKVGIVACSGEERAEGTVTRLAALQVLEQLRAQDTVTICLPLFLAGGEGDRAFARFYPTIAIDGCDRRCAAKATEMYSGKPAASVVVADLLRERSIGTAHRLNEAGRQAVDWTAEHTARLVDELLDRRWDRRAGEFFDEHKTTEAAEPIEATCACGSGIPVQMVEIAGQRVTLIALPVIFRQFHGVGRLPSDQVTRELLDMVKIYNVVPAEQEADYLAMLEQEYAAYCAKVTT